MSRIRLIEPGVIYEVVHRTVDRTFSFAPDHDEDQPLLQRGCPAYALDPRSDLLPVPSTLNIIGAALARAQELAPVRLHAAEFNLTHPHTVISACDDQLTNIAEFYRIAMSLIARRLNYWRGREGHLFGGALRLTPCGSHLQAAQKVLYAMTNTVKDGLTSTVRRSPMFNTYRAQALGQEQRYFDFDFRRYHAAGGQANPRLRLKDFMVWRTLELTPLPGLSGMTPEQIQTYWRKQVREVEEDTAAKLKAEGRTFMPPTRLMTLDLRDRPKEPRKESHRQPLIHADTAEDAKAYEEKYNEVRKQHRVASIAYRQGDLTVEFPRGTYRPPLIQVIDSS